MLPLHGFFIAKVSADSLQNRSVSLSSYRPSQVATHNYQFFVPNPNIMGSMIFEYCSNSAVFIDPCTAPAGLDVSGAITTAQTGNTGFSVDNADTTANKLVISRLPLASSVITSSYSFANITNPSTASQTIYVRISTYGSTDGSGSMINSGAVAFVTSTDFNVSATVPPFIRLCVGITVAVDCSAVNGDSLDLGDLSKNHASVGQSQFAVGTNSANGYSVFALGTTMTSGSDVIPALSAPAPSFPGNGQFGINLRANTLPASGQDPDGTGTGGPTANYDNPNQFVFVPGDEIANSLLPSDYNRMTVSYLANINNGQPIGIYSTTITYVAVTEF